MDDIYKILLVIDVQKQFRDRNEGYDRCLDFIRVHRNSYYIIGTLFKNLPHSMYEEHLLWTDCKNASQKDIEYEYDDLFVKYGYSFRDGHSVKTGKKFDDVRRDIMFRVGMKTDDVLPAIEYDVIGCDAEACVLASAFSLWDSGENFKVLSDFVYTNSETVSKDLTLKIMKANFGNCII